MDADSIISVRNFDLLCLIFYPSHIFLVQESEKKRKRGWGEEHVCFSLKIIIIITYIFLGRKVTDPGDKMIVPNPPKRKEEGSQLGEIYVVNFIGSHCTFTLRFEGSTILGV